MICDLGRQSVPDLSNTADDLRATHGYMLHSIDVLGELDLALCRYNVPGPLVPAKNRIKIY